MWGSSSVKHTLFVKKKRKNHQFKYICHASLTFLMKLSYTKTRTHYTYMGASMVKWTKKVLHYTKTIMSLVKGLKVIAKRYLNWILFFKMTFVVMLNTQM